jgi:D-alanyl-D-alanine carboxypeptidase (penicillin-binding protein 5/6)
VFFFNKKSNRFLLILIGLSFTCTATFAFQTPPPPKLAASSYIIMDFDSGKILAKKNPHKQLEPASITKIMTAYAVLNEIKEGNIDLSDKTLISDKAWRMGGSRMFLEPNSSLDVDTLLKGMIIQSGNDASVALAEHVSGNEMQFAQLMNRHAQRLGMKNTYFVNSTGMPNENHLTTAYDIALMSMATIRDFPEHYAVYAEKEFTHNNIKQYNRNKLLWSDSSVDGIKTGHTDNAGYCLVASAKRENMRLISVVMGTKSKEARSVISQALLDYGFQNFETHRLYKAGDTLNNSRVWMGEQERLAQGLASDLIVTIPRRQYKKLKARLALNSPLEAPIQKGQEIGKVVITLNEETYKEVPLIALHDVASGGLWTRIKDSILRRFE